MRAVPPVTLPSAPGAFCQLSTFTAEPITWLWQPYIACGKLTILAGMPGIGKSWFSLDIAARCTRGEFGDRRNVVLLNAEDDNADSILPRAIALGADAGRITVQPDSTVLDEQTMDALARQCTAVNAVLAIIDPVQAYVEAGRDFYRPNQVREWTTRLRRVATAANCAILLVGHFGKGRRGHVLERFIGSIDIVGSVRSALAAREWTDEGRRGLLISQVKNNVGPRGASLFFAPPNDDGPLVRRESSASVEDALDDDNDQADGRGGVKRVDAAVAWLREQLADGPVAARTVQSAARAEGISIRTLTRAKGMLGVVASGGRAGWHWELGCGEDA